jgi:hypothetical protein
LGVPDQYGQRLPDRAAMNARWGRPSARPSVAQICRLHFVVVDEYLDVGLNEFDLREDLIGGRSPGKWYGMEGEVRGKLVLYARIPDGWPRHLALIHR